MLFGFAQRTLSVMFVQRDLNVDFELAIVERLENVAIRGRNLGAF